MLEDGLMGNSRVRVNYAQKMKHIAVISQTASTAAKDS